LELIIPAFSEGGIVLNIKDGPYYTYLLENKNLLEQLSHEFFEEKVIIAVKADENAVIPVKAKEGDNIIKEVIKTLGGKMVEDRRRANV